MAQIEDIVRLVRGVLGPDAVGAYLHGSAVLGESRHRSDIDVLVVSARPLAAGERRALLDGLLTISGGGASPSSRPVELTIVVQSDVRPWRYPPRSEFQYGEWLRDEYPGRRSGERRSGPTHHDDAAGQAATLRTTAGRRA